MAGPLQLFTTLLLVGQVNLPGTQPSELTLPPEPSSTCSCHDGYDPDRIIEPGQAYRATPMALAARDPVFRAAFVVARQDRPALTDLCLRCHTPVGWLNARSEGDLSELIPDDLDGVSCDVCHRMVAADPPLVGSGQYTISPQTTKRSGRGAAPFGGHQVLRTEYTGSAGMCGVCHSLFNPAEQAHGPDAEQLEGVYYEQRTFEEWRDSVFGQRDESCIECHMQRVQGSAVRGGEEYPDLAVHSMVGGNDFVVNAVRVLNPNLPIAAEAIQVSQWVKDNLRRAAELEIRSPAVSVQTGDSWGVDVRVTNKTGHKLPTGYPEGRRIYLEVSLQLDGQLPVTLSGRWDQQSGNVVPDPQLRTYETEHGRVENGVGERTRHLILMNQIMTDTRIPPEGFMPQHEDMIPAGRDYGLQAPYRHWDDHTYSFEGPTVAQTTTGTITVRLMHQAIDGDVVRFLTETAAGTPEADDLQRAWDMLSHAPPKEMVKASIPITVQPPPPPADAGVVLDAGGGADSGVATPEDPDGCRCLGVTAPATASWWGFALLLLWGRRKLRRSPRRAQ